MTFKKFIIYSLIQWVILIFLKIWFFSQVIFTNPGLQEVVYWILVPVIGVAIVRRLGLINFFEALFVILVWVVLGMLFDLLITSIYTGLGFFSSTEYWAGIIAFGSAIFIFHKKRHIHVRHELAAARHKKH